MKEGLALLNGTQFSLAYGVWAIIESERLSALADLIAAMSADAFACVMSPFDERLHLIRPHAGQLKTAENIRKLLKDSVLAKQPKNVVQDPYSFRCVPQVHGASKDSINYVKSVLETEINSVTDNPNIFPDSDAILSGGNFHAQVLALPLDFLAMALAELGSISERRLYQLIGGHRGLPAFLTKNSGLNSGLMIGQYTAASIVSQNKQLCTPASVDSIVSCNGQEDHVSMAANAGTKLYRVVENLERLLAIEFMAAAQGLWLREAKSGSAIEKVLESYRKIVAPIEEDRIFHQDLIKTIEFLKSVDAQQLLK
jgi:histidine ammonia-lyase